MRDAARRIPGVTVIIHVRKRAVIGSVNLTIGRMARNYEIGVRMGGREAWNLSKIINSLAGA